MKWRLETRENYYPTLVKRWEEWGFPIIPYDLIPNRIFVVYVDDEIDVVKRTDLYAVPVYITDTGICWIGFPTGNKFAPKEAKEGALDYLLEVIETCMKFQGFKLILTTSNTPKLMEAFTNNGFTVSDEGTNFYTKNI